MEEQDWRITGGEEILTGKIFKKIKFPEFWNKSYREKNLFYQKIIEDAENFVKKYRRGEEYLEGEKVQEFWHEHCFFCWKKFMTDMDVECYCTQDYYYWICTQCFEDFKERFHLSVSDEEI